MAKTSAQIEQEFIRDLKSNTGQDLKAWLGTLAECGTTKHNELIKFMKEQHGWRHQNASLLAGIFRNDGKPVYASDDDLLESQLAKYPEWRPVFEVVSKSILDAVPGSTMIPKKTYVSFARKREFAAVNIKSKELRLGMDLGDMPEEGIVERAKLTGPMPRISRMVMITGEGGMTPEVISLLRQADERVNG